MERFFGLQVTGLTLLTLLIVGVSGMYSYQHGASLMNGSNRMSPANAPKPPAVLAGIPANFAPSDKVGAFVHAVNKGDGAVFIGNQKAPTVYVMFDANCTACHFEWMSLQKYIEAGQLRVGFVPVQVINHGSLVQGARILAAHDRAAAFRKVEAAFKPADEAGGGPTYKSVPLTGKLGRWSQQVKANTQWVKKLAYYGVPITVIPGKGKLGYTHEGLLSPGDFARMVERGDRLAMQHGATSIGAGPTQASEVARLSAAHYMKLASEKAYLAARAGATEHPNGARHDYEMAYSYYQRAAMMGSAEAAYQLGLYWGSGKADNKGMNNPEGVKMATYWFTQAAKLGDAKAAQGLGLMYMTSEGMKKSPQDMKLAAKWLGLAAQQGKPIAENDLGMLYYYGRGVKRDLNKARHWFKMAADQGYRRARVNLAYLDSQSNHPQAGQGSSTEYVVPAVSGK
jgi:TPR repeat protein